MGQTDVWGEFTPEERIVLKRALHVRARDQTQEERRIVLEYWRRMKRRSDHPVKGQVDARHSPAYREWLVYNELPLEPYNPRHYRAWKRGHDRWIQ